MAPQVLHSDLVRWAILSALLVGPCLAQFRDLATTDDGAELYFSSRFRQIGEVQFLHPKIFRWSDGKFELVSQREQIGLGRFVNFFQLVSPDVSGDGSLVTAVAMRDCFGGSGCLYVERFTPEVLTGAVPLELRSGRIQVSRSGRYLLSFGSTGFESRAVERIDLRSGERTTSDFPSGWVPSDRQCTTAAGEVLLAFRSALALWDGQELQVVGLNATPASAIVSDDGSQAIYQSGEFGGPFELWAIRLDGSNLVRLAGPQDRPFHPAVSNDGRTVVFVADRRVVVVDLVAGTQQVLDQPNDFAMEATISGDGLVVYAAASTNSLWRIDRASDAARELVPGVVAVDQVLGAPAPGSLNWIRGSGLARRLRFAELPYPRSLDGVHVEVGGEQAAILAVAPEQIVYQIPWEVQLGETKVNVSGPDSPFEFPQPSTELRERRFDVIEAGAEAHVVNLSFGTVVVDQDFQRLITNANRARSGDIVHIYATGAGRVTAVVRTGEPSPGRPLPVLSEPLDCEYFDSGNRMPLDVLYTGLAPGLVGVYQITFRIPDKVRPFTTDPSIGSLTGRCGDDEGVAAFFSVPLMFPRSSTSF